MPLSCQIITFLSLWWELLRSTLSNFQIYNTTLTIIAMSYIRSPELIPFITESSHHLTNNSQFPWHPSLWWLPCYFCFWVWLFYIPHISEIIQYLSFSNLFHSPSPIPPPTRAITSLLSVSLFLFCLFVCFSDSTYKWDHTVFVFV